jgi:hypothetical protein
VCVREREYEREREEDREGGVESVCESVRGKIIWTFKMQYKALLWVSESVRRRERKIERVG